MLKGLPAAIDTELNLLGICINNASVLDKVIENLTVKNFYLEKHKIIFNALVNLYTKNISIDTITITEELKKTKKLEDAGGIYYLAQITSSALEFRNVKEYIDIIKEKSNQREIIKLANNMILKATEGIETKEIINKAETKILSLQNVNTTNMQKIDETLVNVFETIERNYNAGGGITGIATGYKTLDKVLSGLNKKDFVVIAARPSMGKTAFALNIAYNIATENNVAIFSLEMSNEQLVQRVLANASCVELEKIKNGNLTEKEWEKVTLFSTKVAEKKITIDDSGTCTVNDIRAKCKRIKATKGLDVIVIDYLQLMSGNGGESRQQDVTEISRGLKQLAKDLDVVVIALSQLSRAPEQRNNHRPILSDLRESGSIEQDADVVMFLYRDAYYNAETEDENIAECILAKNRNGEVGTTKLAWIGQYQKFSQLLIN